MAKLLFAVDHLFQKAGDDTVYTTGGKFPYSKWGEYLAFFENLTVVSRGSPAAADTTRMAISSGPDVDHCLVGAARGWQRIRRLRKDRDLVRRLVSESDAVIGRIPSELGLIACSAATEMKKPYLIELVACPWDALWNHGSLAARIYAPAMTLRVRAAVAAAPLVHYVTREFLQGRYPTSGETVSASNVMLPEADSEIPSRREATIKAISYSTRHLSFGTIGSMTTRLKGIEVALRSLAAGKDSLPDFTYHILGEGDPEGLKKYAEKLGIGDRVRFDGVLPSGMPVARWLDGIDIYLQPSFQEGVPRAMIEALNRGCLAIGSTAGGIPELLPADRLHRPGDSRMLGRRIAALIDTPEAELRREVERNLGVALGYSYGRSLRTKNQIYERLRQKVRGH